MHQRWALLIVAAAACTGGDHRLGTKTRLGMVPNVPIYSVVFDRGGAPVAASNAGLLRYDGSAWVPLPVQGITGTLLPAVSYDLDNNAYAFAVPGGLFTLPPGTSQWQPVDSGGFTFGAAPFVTSDGTLYVPGVQSPLTATSRLYYRRRGETTWTDAGVDAGGDLVRALGDHAGNLWWGTWSGGGHDDGLQRLHEQTTETIPHVWTDAVQFGEVHMLVGADDSALYGVSNNYANNYGEVYRWDLASHTRSTISDGTHCAELDKYVCDDTDVFIYNQLRGADGSFYELLAHQNGETPTLMVLDGDTWWPLLIDLQVGLASSPSGQLYVYGDDGTGMAVFRVDR